MAKTAQLYRMHTDEHLCPFGLKSKDLLKHEGYEVEDHELTSRSEADDFKDRHDVKTTPQTFKRRFFESNSSKYASKKSFEPFNFQFATIILLNSLISSIFIFPYIV